MIEEIAIKDLMQKADKKTRLAMLVGGSLLFVVLFIALVVVLYKRFRPDDLLDKTKRDIDRGNLTYDKSKYEQIAASLYAAMKDWGTDEEAIFRNLKILKTKDDWRALLVAFGRKENKNLVEFLIEELDNSEINAVNVILSTFNESI